MKLGPLRLGKVGRDLGLATSAQLLQKLVGYVALVLLARYLTKESMGEFFFVTTLASLVALPSEAGTSKYLARATAERPERALEELSRVVALRLPLLAACLLLGGGIALFLRPELALLVALALLHGLVSDFYYAFGATFVGLRRMKLRFATAAVGDLLLLGLVVAAVRTGASLPVILLAYVASAAAAVGIAIVAVRVGIGAFRPRWDASAAREVLRRSWPFFVMSVLGLVYFKVDTVMLFVLRTAPEVATYETGFKILEVSRTAVRPLHLIFLPIAAGMVVASEWDELRTLVRRLLVGVTAVGVAATAVVGLGAEPIVSIIWGARYDETVPVLRLLFLTVPFLYLGMVCTFLSFALHLERATIRILLVCLGLNVGLNLVAIPTWGAAGAAGATVVTEVVLAAALLRLLLRHLRAGEAGARPSSSGRVAGEPEPPGEVAGRAPEAPTPAAGP